jgi:hypothetical protein
VYFNDDQVNFVSLTKPLMYEIRLIYHKLHAHVGCPSIASLCMHDTQHDAHTRFHAEFAKQRFAVMPHGIVGNTQFPGDVAHQALATQQRGHLGLALRETQPLHNPPPVGHREQRRPAVVESSFAWRGHRPIQSESFGPRDSARPPLAPYSANVVGSLRGFGRNSGESLDHRGHGRGGERARPLTSAAADIKGRRDARTSEPTAGRGKRTQGGQFVW